MLARANLKSTLEVVSSLAMLMAAGALLFTIYTGKTASSPTLERISGTIHQDEIANSLGTGRIAIVEFADFQCSYCIKHAREVFPEIERLYLKEGKAKYIFVSYPLERIHPLAKKASEAAECASDQGQYWQMHKRLFDVSPALEPQKLADYAMSLGLDVGRFKGCLDSSSASQRIARDVAIGTRLGVAGTPVFLFGVVSKNGDVELRSRLKGAVPLSQIEAAIASMSQL